MVDTGVTLADKYALQQGRVFATCMQALARLPMMQKARDVAAGLNTAGFVSGYRGSPLGGLDRAMVDAREHLVRSDVRFLPGVNEELAATSVWGTQQLHLFPKPERDGVFAMWYGKGPGVDRCSDVFKHANHAGTSRHGGVLAVAGDDHAARSSAVAHQSEHLFAACAMPVLAPSNVQECIDFGLHGWAMSRYSGLWVALKLSSEVAESSAVLDVDPQRVSISIPTDFALPPDGVHLRWPDPQLAQEQRIQQYKVYAALAYCRENRLNRITIEPARARFGIVSCGKAYQDVLQALELLGIDEGVAGEIGLRLYKVGMVWPLEARGVREFAEGLEEILVVEEKRPLIEYQIKEELYNWRDDVRPKVIGKFDERGEWSPLVMEDGTMRHAQWLLPPTGELTPAGIARAIARRIGRFYRSDSIDARIAFLERIEVELAKPRHTMARPPYFCPGCPHNTSTRVPEDSCALGGVGCHLMATWMDRRTMTVSQMGGEGAAWIGASPFSGTSHVFANMGDGTYFHSGILAVRAAVAADVSITFKLLFNDAVAMTGGQPLDGTLTVPQLTRQLVDEGVTKVVVVADDPSRYPRGAAFAPGVQVHGREELDRIQQELVAHVGVSALVYDQACAAQARRGRARGTSPVPQRRVFINEMLCEGCADCAAVSNCVAVVPVETDFGRKSAIDQAACNLDLSCLAGACPALVTVEGGRRRRATPLTGLLDEAFESLAAPELPPASEPFAILVAGIGGTGVVTIGALLGMAAHLDAKSATVLDMTGLSQKGGAVVSHVRICDDPTRLHATRIATGEADLVLGCDLAVTAGSESLSKIDAARTRVVVNTARGPIAEYIRNPAFEHPQGEMVHAIEASVAPTALDRVDAAGLVARLCGDTQYTNMFMLGFAWQKGAIPLTLAALRRAIELNGVAVRENLSALEWGRIAASRPATLAAIGVPAHDARDTRDAPGAKLDAAIDRYAGVVRASQGAAGEARYRALLERVRARENEVVPASGALLGAVARGYFRLLACKDEYEVARLYRDPAFRRGIAEAFEGDYRIRYHFSLPFLDRSAGAGGRPRKRSIPWWIAEPALALLARARGLRQTVFDPLARQAESRANRALVQAYEEDVAVLIANLSPENHEIAVEIAALADTVRGFGSVRSANAKRAQARREPLMRSFAASRLPVEESAHAD